MNFIKKIIESIGFLKNNKKLDISNSVEDDKKTYFYFENNENLIKDFLNSVNLILNKLNEAWEISLGCPKKKNEAITSQVKELKSLLKMLKEIITKMSEAKNYLHELKLIDQYKIIDQDCKFIEKIHNFIGDTKNEECLICKLLYAKKEKNMKRKNYILKNQINRLKNKLKSLEEFLKK